MGAACAAPPPARRRRPRCCGRRPRRRAAAWSAGRPARRAGQAESHRARCAEMVSCSPPPVNSARNWPPVSGLPLVTRRRAAAAGSGSAPGERQGADGGPVGDEEISAAVRNRHAAPMRLHAVVTAPRSLAGAKGAGPEQHATVENDCQHHITIVQRLSVTGSLVAGVGEFHSLRAWWQGRRVGSSGSERRLTRAPSSRRVTAAVLAGNSKVTQAAAPRRGVPSPAGPLPFRHVLRQPDRGAPGCRGPADGAQAGSIALSPRRAGGTPRRRRTRPVSQGVGTRPVVT
ncbi:hypothetical protein SUDANB15_07119 [Streptomyces sp. enrichment culture]